MSELNTQQLHGASMEQEAFLNDYNFNTTPEEVPPLPSCETCKNTRLILFESREGFIGAQLCSCIVAAESRGGHWEHIQHLKRKIAIIQCAEIPNRYLAASESKGIRREVLDWLDKFLTGEKVNHFLFLHGNVGSGKTHAAIHILLRILADESEHSVAYIPIYKLVEYRRKYRDEMYSKDPQIKEQATHAYDHYRNQIIHYDFVVLDELGQETLTPDERKFIFDILDSRYSSNKITISISNHCDKKALSLDGKLLTSLVGSRIASRMKSAETVYFSGQDLRAQEGSEILSKEEVDNFMVPAKILTHDDDEHQIMNWLARNPAFEVVSTQKRKGLTYVDEDGEEKDMDRPKARFERDVWVLGDSLQISGPICDHEDKKLYALLVKNLVQNHSNGNKGLVIELSFTSILKSLGMAVGGNTVNVLKRQLSRLNRMHLEFKNVKGSRWSGPLLTTVYQKGESRDRKVFIEFNRYMITFYKIHEYTTFSKTISNRLGGDSSAFYLFYSSHSLKEMHVPVEKCKKLLAIPENFDKKEALKRVKKAVQNLIDAKVMDPKKTFIKEGKVHTCLISA